MAALASTVRARALDAARNYLRTHRDELISLRGLSHPTRFLILLGFAFLFGMGVALLFNRGLRDQSDLLALTGSVQTAGRGSLVPVSFFPATIFMLAVAWSFSLTGALHSHPVIRVLALLFYLPTITAWLSKIIEKGLEGNLPSSQLFVALGLIAVVPVFFAIRWRAPAQPALEFGVMLVCVAAAFGIAQAVEVEEWRRSGIPIALVRLEGNINALEGLIAPMLIVIGVDWANFARKTARSITQFISKRLPAFGIYASLVVLFLVRGQQTVSETLARLELDSFQIEAPQYLGALSEVLLVGFIWLLITRLARASKSAAPLGEEDIAKSVERSAFPLVLIYMMLPLIAILAAIIVTAIPSIGVGLAIQQQFLKLLGVLNNQLTAPWKTLVFVGSLALAIWLARRGNRSLAIYLAMFGALNIWLELASPGYPLGFLSWQGSEPVDFWWVIVFACIALFWWVRRALTLMRAASLIFVLLISLLLSRIESISNPFGSISGLTGLSFIAIGIVWNVLSAGSWANESTTALPRVSRIFLYLGYVLFSITLINWALTSHDLDALGKFTGDWAVIGRQALARPFLYAIFGATLAPDVERER